MTTAAPSRFTAKLCAPLARFPKAIAQQQVIPFDLKGIRRTNGSVAILASPVGQDNLCLFFQKGEKLQWVAYGINDLGHMHSGFSAPIKQCDFSGKEYEVI